MKYEKKAVFFFFPAAAPQTGCGGGKMQGMH
jgi:hypothetical protein